MERRNWGIAVGAVAAVALIGAYAVYDGHPAKTADTVAVVGAPVVVQRSTAAEPPAAPFPKLDAVRQRPERKIVERIASHDRRGGDIKMMAAMMTTQPAPAAPAPIEATMSAAVARLPVFATGSAPPKVTCMKTACEVAGLIPRGQTEASMTAIFRDRDFERTLLARGYSPGPVMVADAGDGSTGFVFYINNEF